MSNNQHEKLLEAILPHVVFDGWSETSFNAACADLNLTAEDAKLLCPRGAIDLAQAFHRAGDAAMVQAMSDADLSGFRYSEKVAQALKFRVAAMSEHREAVRRASSLFALPQNTGEGAKLIWETADHVWKALGDTSEDVNWYTKRATLSAVWAAVVLFWLGDESEDSVSTSAFIDRRIEDVMRIEKAKAAFRENPLTRPLASFQSSLLSGIRAPSDREVDDLPGRWAPPKS